MAITQDQARAELARRELARRGASQKEGLDYKSVIGKAMTAANPVEMTKKFFQTDPAAMQRNAGGALPIMGGFAAGPAGAAGGEFLRQMTGTALAPESVPQTAMGRAGSVMESGILQEPSVLRGVPGVNKALSGAEALAKPLGSGLSKLGETMTGVPKRQFQRLWKDPTALFIPKTLGQAGKEFGSTLEKEGISTAPNAAEINDPQLAVARKNVKGFFDRLKNGVKTGIDIPYLKGTEVPGEMKNAIEIKTTGNVEPFGLNKKASLAEAPLPTVKPEVVTKEFVGKYKPSAGDVLKARRGTDRIIAGTPWKDKEGLHNLYKQRGELNEMFENASGPGSDASKKYARSALASNFRKLLPETQTGKISYVKSILAPLAMRAAALGSPALAGLMTSGASLTSKAIASSPVLRQAIMQAIQRIRQSEPQKQ